MHPYNAGGPPPPAMPDNRWRDRNNRPGPVIVETPPLPSSIYSPHPHPPPMYSQFQPPPMLHHPPFSPPPEMMPPMQHYIPMPPAPLVYAQPPPPPPPVVIPILPTPPPAPPKIQPYIPPPSVSYGDFAPGDQCSAAAKLPWLSSPDEAFPARRRKPRTIKKRIVKPPQIPPQPILVDTPPPSTQAPSEVDSTVPTTPISAPSSVSTAAPKKISPATPPPPAVPALPIKTAHKRTGSTRTVTKRDVPVPAKEEEPKEATEPAAEQPANAEVAPAVTEEAAAPAPAPAVAPKSWAELVKKTSTANGTVVAPVAKSNGVVTVKNVSLAEALASFSLEDVKAPLIQPRGLVNTGNMCFMNAVSYSLLPFTRILLIVLGVASSCVLRSILQLPPAPRQQGHSQLQGRNSLV